MRIKYILLHQPLSLPGQGTGKKWSATGTDGRQSGIVKSITETTKGYALEIAVGPHKGFYDILDNAVQFACKESDGDVAEKSADGALSTLATAYAGSTPAASSPTAGATTGAEPKPQRNHKHRRG